MKAHVAGITGALTIALVATVGFAQSSFGETTARPGFSAPDVVLSEAEKQQALGDLKAKKLLMPLEKIDVERLKGSFYETHGGSQHKAVDILSPRNTPIHAVEDGTIARLFESRLGGHTIYEIDPSNRFVYYYAHLESYADGLKDGDAVKKGQVIGYVGTSGNAPPNTPHLHFSIGVMGPKKQTWKTFDIDPYEVYAAGAASH